MSSESKNRMITFRLSGEEYDKFRDLCFTQGIRSVSETARAAVSLLLQQPSQVTQVSLESRISELEGRVHLLALELKRLNQTISSPRPAEPGPQAVSGVLAD